MKTVLLNELDKPRKLRLETNALSDAEQVLDMGIGRVMQKELGIAMIRALLWAGLKWQDPGLTLTKVGGLMNVYLENGGDLEVLGAKVGEALIASGLFNKQLEGEDPNVEPETVEE